MTWGWKWMNMMTVTINSWWHEGRKNIIILRCSWQLEQNQVAPHTWMIAPNNRGVAAPKFGCSRTWRVAKKGRLCSRSATNCQLGQMKIQGRTLEEASNSRVLLDDLITKIIITISRPSPVQRGLPWYLKWILALPPYLSYVQTYVTIYSPHILFVVT